MMPVAEDGNDDPNGLCYLSLAGHSTQDHQIDYKQKYKALKKKLKFLVYEQESFLEELRKAQRKLLKISRDRSFLLDRLLQYEKVDESSGDSDATGSSDSEADGHKDGSSTKRKKMGGSGHGHQGNVSFGNDPSLFGGLGMAGIGKGPSGLLMPAGHGPVSSKKRSRPSAKKSKSKSEPEKVPGQMTREELERHLESRKHSFVIEKTPTQMPMDIFSNDNSNQDSDALDIRDGEEDGELVIDSGH